MLIENRNYLRSKNRSLLNQLNQNSGNNDVEVSVAKNGELTLSVHQNNIKQHIHSSYNPYKEVELLLKKYDHILNEGDPIIFIGLGLGYHIKPFLEKYNPTRFSFLEFNIEILKKALEYFNLTDSMLNNLVNVYNIESETEYSEILVDEMQNNKLPKMIILPSYERIYGNEINEFKQLFKDLMLNKKDRYTTNINFQNRWALNSLMNLPYVLKTPNLLNDIDIESFKDKPTIIVSAGPSLNEEFEKLKKIKKKKSAYIFSMGSAINALIEHGIYPDAAFTYDPKEKNQFVFEKLKKKNIKDIPLIFGSSVGYETLNNYPGQMLHFLTSKDTVSPSILKNDSCKLEKITDAPSIAVMALQILIKLGCSPIVFVGQNLSYSDVRYARGIDYAWLNNQLSAEELENTFEVESVDGGVVQANDLMVKMKNGLEHYLSQNPFTKFYNTTKKGAKIKYTEYVSLERLASTFKEGAVETNWLKTNASKYNSRIVYKNFLNLVKEKDIVDNVLKRMEILLEDLKNAKTVKYNEKQLELGIQSIGQYIYQIESTTFYHVFLASMSRHELEIISGGIREVMSLRKSREKINLLLNYYSQLNITWIKICGLVNEKMIEINRTLVNENYDG